MDQAPADRIPPYGLLSPALPAAALVLAGLGIARATPVAAAPVLQIGMGAFLFAGATALLCRRRRPAMAALALAFLCGGLALETGEQARYRRARASLEPLGPRIESGQTIRLEGVTGELPKPGPDGDSLEATVRIQKVWLRGEPAKTDFPALVRVYQPGSLTADWRRGDRVQALARISLPRGFRNRGSLPAAIYYWNRNNVCLAVCKSSILFERIGGTAEGPLDGLYRRLAIRIRQLAASPQTGEVLEALLLGRNVTSVDLRNAYIDAGVYHLLVISGSHLTLLALFIGGLLAVLRLPARWRPWVLIPLLAVYVDFVQLQVSVVRAFLIVALFLAGAMANRPASLMNATALAALILLAFKPGWIADPGFQLTFAAVFALALAAEPMDRLWVRPWVLAARNLFSDKVNLDPAPEQAGGRRRRFWLEKVRFLFMEGISPVVFGRGIRAILSPAVWASRSLVATVAVLMVTVPVLAAAHFPVPLAGMACTAAALLLIWPILVLLVGAALSAGWPAASDLLIRGAAVLAEILNRWVVRVDAVPLWLPPLGAVLAAAYLALLALLLRGQRARPAMAAGLCALLLAAALWAPLPGPSRPRLSMLDVGEGEALLLQAPGGRAVLVDTGGLAPIGPLTETAMSRGDLSRRVLVPVLLESGVRSLDALILTHQDFDHAGSAAGLLRVFPVRRLYASAADWSREPELARRLSQAAAERNVPVRLLAAGDCLELPPLRLRVLHPPSNWKTARGNANSLVLLGSGFGAEFLLTGDIDDPVERELAEAGSLPEATVLKLAHHGSRTSSSKIFLETVRPGLALISSGPPERFSHPSPVVLERLDRLGIAHLTTHDFGQIDLVFEGDRLRLEYPAPVPPPTP